MMSNIFVNKATIGKPIGSSNVNVNKYECLCVLIRKDTVSIDIAERNDNTREHTDIAEYYKVPYHDFRTQDWQSYDDASFLDNKYPVVVFGFSITVDTVNGTAKSKPLESYSLGDGLEIMHVSLTASVQNQNLRSKNTAGDNVPSVTRKTDMTWPKNKQWSTQ